MFTAVVTLMGLMTLTSCFDKNTKSGQLTTELCIESSRDLMEVCDIEVTYKGKGGVNLIDTITDTEWNMRIINDSFPTKIGIVNCRYLLKPGIKHLKDYYMLKSRYTISNLERDYTIDYYPLRDKVPGHMVDSILELINYFNKDIIKQEEDPNWQIASIATVTKDTSDPKNVKFVFGYSNGDPITEWVPVGIDPMTGETIYGWK